MQRLFEMCGFDYLVLTLNASARITPFTQTRAASSTFCGHDAYLPQPQVIPFSDIPGLFFCNPFNFVHMSELSAALAPGPSCGLALAFIITCNA